MRQQFVTNTMEENEPPPTLDSMFEAFSKLGSTLPSTDASRILLSQLDRWMQQAELFNENFTLTDTGMEYNKFKLVLTFKNTIIYKIRLQEMESIVR